MNNKNGTWSIGRGHLFRKFSRHVNGSTIEKEVFNQIRNVNQCDYSNESIENYFGHNLQADRVEEAMKEYTNLNFSKASHRSDVTDESSISKVYQEDNREEINACEKTRLCSKIPKRNSLLPDESSATKAHHENNNEDIINAVEEISFWPKLPKRNALLMSLHNNFKNLNQNSE